MLPQRAYRDALTLGATSLWSARTNLEVMADLKAIEDIRLAANARPRVLIVGAGFGGLACARKLDRKPVDVLLVDERNYHLFTPLLYQVATALLTPSDISYPLRRVFRGSPNVRVMHARVVGVDFQRKVVKVAAGKELG